MKYFDVRYSANLSAPPVWPQQPPGVEVVALPSRLYLPLSVRASADAPTPAVLPAGTRVDRGQMLAAAVLPTAAAVLAPAAGRVVGQGLVTLLNGQHVPCVEIEVDEAAPPTVADAAQPCATPPADWDDFAGPLFAAAPQHVGEWIDRLRIAGVWADRPACPDLLSQLNDAAGRLTAKPARGKVAAPAGRVDTVLCNLLDDEPTLRLNSTLAARHGPDLLAGLHLLAKLFAARNVWAVTEAGAPGKWSETLRRGGRKLAVTLVPLLNDYPQSDPTLLLYAMLKRRLKPGRLPTGQRVLMLDAAAAVAVGRCALRGEAMLRVPLAVRDHVARRTHLLDVPVGTPLRHILTSRDIPFDGVQLLRGDVLHENEVDADAVVAGGELTVHVLPRTTKPAPDPCIRCSWCVESCPTRVQPAGVLEASQRGDASLARHYGIDACIECGVCTYVCPSHLPLLAGIRKLRGKEGEVASC